MLHTSIVRYATYMKEDFIAYTSNVTALWVPMGSNKETHYFQTNAMFHRESSEHELSAV